jgi:hypothetical protein
LLRSQATHGNHAASIRVGWRDAALSAQRVGCAAAAGNKYARLKPHLDYSTDWDLGRADPDKDYHTQIFDTGAAIVVFYCNHCSSSSPAAAERHLAWLRGRRPDSRQQVKVLHRGMGGLVHRARELGRADGLFARIYRC